MIKSIETQTNRQKRQRIRNLIIGVIIVALMVLSTVGYVILDAGNSTDENIATVSYNGFTFFPVQNGWQVSVQAFNLTTYYTPAETFEANGTGNIDLSMFSDKIVYLVVSDEQGTSASTDLGRNLDLIVRRVQFACSLEAENSSFCQQGNFPIKTCDDVTSDSKIIIINQTLNKTNYEINNGCIIINGDGSGLIRASDNFIFKLFGIL